MNMKHALLLCVGLASLVTAAAPAEASGSLDPSYIRKHFPASIVPLLLKENDAQDECTGTYHAGTEAACQRAERLQKEVEHRGWCYGPDDASESEKMWMRLGTRCHAG